jgi:PleD family two-component response regulator
LFNPDLPDASGFRTFTLLRETAPDVALIALVGAGDESLGRRMLREGAQDYIVKDEVDCRPLARALLNAIERQRFQRCARLLSAIDLETGFQQLANFREAAARDLDLAGDCSRPLSLVVAEIDNLAEAGEACGPETVHELVVEAAGVIRAAAGPTALIGRVTTARFAVVSWQDPPDRLVTKAQCGVQEGHHPIAFVFGCATAHPGSATTVEHLLQAAEAALYENKQAYSHLP